MLSLSGMKSRVNNHFKALFPDQNPNKLQFGLINALDEPVDKSFQIVILKTTQDEYKKLYSHAYPLSWILPLILISLLLLFCIVVAVVNRIRNQRLAQQLRDQQDDDKAPLNLHPRN